MCKHHGVCMHVCTDFMYISTQFFMFSHMKKGTLIHEFSLNACKRKCVRKKKKLIEGKVQEVKYSLRVRQMTCLFILLYVSKAPHRQFYFLSFLNFFLYSLQQFSTYTFFQGLVNSNLMKHFIFKLFLLLLPPSRACQIT